MLNDKDIMEITEDIKLYTDTTGKRHPKRNAAIELEIVMQSGEKDYISITAYHSQGTKTGVAGNYVIENIKGLNRSGNFLKRLSCKAYCDLRRT